MSRIKIYNKDLKEWQYADVAAGGGSTEEAKCLDKVGCNIYTVVSEISGTIKPIEDVSEYMDRLAGYGIKHVLLPVVVQPSPDDKAAIEASENKDSTFSAAELKVYPPIEYIDDFFELANRKGIKVDGIKVHSFWLRELYPKINRNTFFNKYRSIVLEIANRYKSSIKFINVLNEMYNVLEDENATQHIVSLLDSIEDVQKSICGVDVNDEIAGHIDFFAPHSYPHISSKEDRTTISDYVCAWKNSGLIEKVRQKKYIGKPVFVTETGVQNYWESLNYPEHYMENGTKSDENLVQAMYIATLVDYLKHTNVSRYYLWYFDTQKHYQLVHGAIRGKLI